MSGQLPTRDERLAESKAAVAEGRARDRAVQLEYLADFFAPMQRWLAAQIVACLDAGATWSEVAARLRLTETTARRRWLPWTKDLRAEYEAPLCPRCGGPEYLAPFAYDESYDEWLAREAHAAEHDPERDITPEQIGEQVAEAASGGVTPRKLARLAERLAAVAEAQADAQCARHGQRG